MDPIQKRELENTGTHQLFHPAPPHTGEEVVDATRDDDPRLEDRPDLDRRRTDRRQTNVRVFAATIVVTAVLYFARPVVMPLAVAALFAFLLTPIVSLLERVMLPRIIAVGVTVILAVALIGLGAWSLTLQVNALAKEISMYSGRIEKKLRILHTKSGTSFALVERTLERLAASTEPQERADLKVRVIERKNLADRYEATAPKIEAVASSFLVIVMVFFLLKDREKLRDKLLRLAGRANLTVTTQAISETINRISRYLLTQALINTAFGIVIGLGLYFLDVPHALLWGVLSALFRFIPYVGAIVSGAAPVFISLAFFDNWIIPLAVLALIVVTDQVLSGLIEPMVIGHRIGISPFALLFATIFWGWLWGPLGLLLATPITVCLTVGGEYIPALRPFSILFSAETPLEDYLSFFNRLLMRDRPRAYAIADSYAEENSMEEAFSDLFIPTLNFALDELSNERITSAQDHFIKDVTRELIIRLGDLNAESGDADQRVVAVSAGGERVSLGTLMLSQLLRAEGYTVDTFTDLPEEEVIRYIREVRALAVFVSCSHPKNLPHGYQLLGILSATFRDIMILAGGSAFAQNREETLAHGATYVATALSEAKDDFLSYARRARRARVRATAV